MFKFRIYVAGDALNSTQATANLSALCRSHMPNRHQIEVVDGLMTRSVRWRMAS